MSFLDKDVRSMNRSFLPSMGFPFSFYQDLTSDISSVPLSPFSELFPSRYLKLFTPLAPTLAQISQHHFERNPERVRNLRPDSLSQILGLSNVRPGGRYLIIDSTGGVLAAGCLERMGGECRKSPMITSLSALRHLMLLPCFFLTYTLSR